MFSSTIRSGRGRLLMAIAGALVYAVGVNFFAVPARLYTGGLLGAARTLAAALWPRRQAFLNRIRVRHLNIFWTVTGADAADTAITYGRRIAACNMALAAARDHIHIQADRLRLEPDFTGKQKEKRCISCQILCRTYIMLIVLKALLQRNEKTGEVPLRKALEQLGAE